MTLLRLSFCALASFAVVARGAVLVTAEPPTRTVQPAAKDAGALLKAAQDSLSEVQTMAYESVVTSEGPLSGGAGTYTAQIAARRLDAGGWAVRAKGELVRKVAAPVKGDGQDGAPGVRPFEVVYDGVTARALHEAKKEVAETSATELDEVRLFFMQQDAGKPVAWELIDVPAYAAATKDATLALDGTESVDGVACNILKLTGQPDGGGVTVTRYFLGAGDNLPRRIERTRLLNGSGELPDKAPNRQVLVLNGFKPDAPVGPAGFVMAVPDGYTVAAAAGRKARTQAPRVVRERPAAGAERETGLLAVGAGAPEWSLKGGDGKSHKLSEYRGKVVVLDFWGTWCPWCIKAMPAIQKVHEKFKGQPVVVLGMNHEGNPQVDPAAYMAKNKFTYGLILNAGDVAPDYKVSGWPTLYVIGADGRILLAKGGFSPTLEQELTEVIEKGLKDSGL
jgi:thiol-disulfide isomerase/thioredoxin